MIMLRQPEAGVAAGQQGISERCRFVPYRLPSNILRVVSVCPTVDHPFGAAFN